MITACYILNICALLSFFDTFLFSNISYNIWLMCKMFFTCVTLKIVFKFFVLGQIWWLGVVTAIQMAVHLSWPFKSCITSYVFASYIHFSILLFFLKKKNLYLLIFFTEIKIILKKNSGHLLPAPLYNKKLWLTC